MTKRKLQYRWRKVKQPNEKLYFQSGGRVDNPYAYAVIKDGKTVTHTFQSYFELLAEIETREGVVYLPLTVYVAFDHCTLLGVYSSPFKAQKVCLQNSEVGDDAPLWTLKGNTLSYKTFTVVAFCLNTI